MSLCLGRDRARPADILRWAASGAAILGLHAGAVALLLRAAPVPETVPLPEAILLELPPDPSAARQPTADRP